MKLDQITPKESLAPVKVKKSESSNAYSENNNTMLDLLNPLKSINLNSNLHSFYNFRQMNENVEKILKTQSNIVYYILHQNFMCDDDHKEFFKNMMGRFYDLPERFWDYYQGLDYRCNTMIGLVLTENYHYYKKYRSAGNPFELYDFISREESEHISIIYFNRLALEEYFGGSIDNRYSCFFSPFNRLRPTNTFATWTNRITPAAFENDYEFGRMTPNEFYIKRKTETQEENFWFIADWDWLNDCSNQPEIKVKLKAFATYSSLGLDKMDEIASELSKVAKDIGVEFDEDWKPKFTKDEEKMIRSLSLTFAWTKAYILKNEDILDLDVLGLNMSVPWDMELVKFFIEKGYGGRMSENKAVFDKVFGPLLTDKIIDMLFRLAYEKYSQI